MLKSSVLRTAGTCKTIFSQLWQTCHIAWTGLLLLLFGPVALQAQDRPNIVLVMVDDMGFSDLGCYGSEIPTPNIDKLAGTGIRLSQFYNTARCCPTRASLLTGLFPHQTGIGHMTEEPANKDAANWGTPGYQGYLNRNCVTMAEVLSTAGYHTYMTGKWHLGILGKEKWPLQRGFEKYYGILAGAASYFQPFGDRQLYHNNTPLPPPTGDYYTTDAFTDSAIAFLRQQEDRKPFFLYLAFNAPHWPLQAKPEDIRPFEGQYAKGWDLVRQQRYERQTSMGLFTGCTSLSPRDSAVRPWSALTASEQQEVAYRMAVYAAQLRAVDRNVGKLVATLEKLGKRDNTLIIFLSDNGACAEPYKELGGGAFNQINDGAQWGAISYGVGWANVSNTPFRKWKREMEEGGIASPLIMNWPKGIRKDQQNRILPATACLIDILPTFLAVSGAQYPDTYQGNKIFSAEGQSLLPLMKGQTLKERPYMYWEHEGNRAIRKGNWKALKDRDNPKWELYDLSCDRSEQQDLAASRPELLEELTIEWNNWARTHMVLPKRPANPGKAAE
ncbi:MAG: arylsulfatase [Candidatus Pseudobacter hemicellulosilyticus]|uniref:Arylsulfatase n=1 Tax=Candidatus Pseudobacter hemicellulosilyticus TaxID=3121375 RepID=A0AAJ6BI03_9BACT|nr:MAG: arylsulfatase [Pseudobacter sp.]